SRLQWNERSSTHTMFLYFMTDHGVLGALILPAMLICVFVGRPKGAQGSHWAFCVFTMYLAFFSHNIFTERYQLLAFAFFAMGGTAEAGQAVRDGLLRPLWAFAGRPVQATYPTTVGMQ